MRGRPRLKAVRIGDSARVRVGTPVLAIGNEAGQGGSPTVAPGVISSLDRTIVASDQSSGLTETLHGMMQTSADIRPGDSGGPLADATGRVIGIDTAAGGGTLYSGYAIPINQAMPIARQIAAGRPGGRVQIGLPAFLGVLVPGQQQHQPPAAGQPGPAPDRHREQQRPRLHQRRHHGGPGQHRADRDRRAGRRGVSAGPRPPQAGLFAGDVITSVGGHAVTSPRSLTALLGRYRPGSQVSLAWVAPGGSLHTAVVTLAAGPAG